VGRLDDVGRHLGRSGDGGVEVVGLEPQQDAVSERSALRVADRAVVVLDPPVVELEDQLIASDEALVIRTAVGAPAAQEPLVPPAAGLDVGHGDQRLGTHGFPIIARALVEGQSGRS
jgi:hypothetical protein